MRYNTRRRHSWCNFLAPNDFEALTSATLAQAGIANPRRVYFPGVRPVLDNPSGLNAHASVADHAAGYRKVAKAAGIAI